MIKQPMLAASKSPDTSKLRYPVYASPKIDGVRAVVVETGGVVELRSRSMKLIRNEFVQAYFRNHPRAKELVGLDGELVVGEPTHPNCMQNTTSGVMSADGEPDFQFFVFDDFLNGFQFAMRSERACVIAADLLESRIKPLWQIPIDTEAELLAQEADYLSRGYEGLIIRDPRGPYKQGRSTEKEGWMLKLKRFVDGEAEVLGVEELLVNLNDQGRDERGYAKRSTAKDGLVPAGKLGALKVRDLQSGVEFCIGSGFTDRQRKELWLIAGSLVGRLAKYKYFPVGVKDAPRHPIFLGFRDRADL